MSWFQQLYWWKLRQAFSLIGLYMTFEHTNHNCITLYYKFNFKLISFLQITPCILILRNKTNNSLQLSVLATLAQTKHRDTCRHFKLTFQKPYTRTALSKLKEHVNHGNPTINKEYILPWTLHFHIQLLSLQKSQQSLRLEIH